MKAQKILLPIVAVIGALVFFSVFIVKEVNQAIVLQFGDPKKIIVEPGINFKLPLLHFIFKPAPGFCCFFRTGSFYAGLMISLEIHNSALISFCRRHCLSTVI